MNREFSRANRDPTIIGHYSSIVNHYLNNIFEIVITTCTGTHQKCAQVFVKELLQIL